MSSEIANKLSEQTRTLVTRFESRLGQFAGRDDLLGALRHLDEDDANRFAREFFGEGEHLAVGVDGSMDYDERMQMILFYSNATTYSCPFSVRDGVSFKLNEVKRAARLSASSAIPLWSEDVSDVLGETFDVELELELEHSMDRIPNAFMTVAEMYLALRSCEAARLIFLDRPISGTYSSLARDVRLLMRRRNTNLARIARRTEQEVLLDIGLSLNIGAPTMELPRRKRFLQNRVIRTLLEGSESPESLSAKLGVSDAQVKKAVKDLKKIDELSGGLLLEDSGGSEIALKPGVQGFWERTYSLALDYCSGVYEHASSPLNVEGDSWLTVLDINTVAFILLQRLCEVAQQKRVLVVGIAKDTTATDISRAVLPFIIKSKIIEAEKNPPRLKNDKAFLSILSAENRGTRPPWRTLGYDSAFSTIVCPSSVGDGEFRSARKFVSRERLFVRGFFQSRSMGKEGRVRSPVFLFDRLYDPEYDSGSVHDLKVDENYSPATVSPYCEGKEPSRMSNLVLKILSMTDNPEVYEAFGHNQLLYLADKAVKAEIRLMKSSLRGVADLRIGSMSKREEVYGIVTTYREQREGVETARMREAGK